MDNKARILVVDDEAGARASLAHVLMREGYDVETAGDGKTALGKLAEFAPNLMLSVSSTPGPVGVELEGQKEAAPELPFVLMLAGGGFETAVSALRDGAISYLTKPLNTDELLIVVERALEQTRLREEASSMRRELHERHSFDNIIGTSPAMQQVLKAVPQIAASRATVLLSGEAGTGKELMAAAIHQHSQRSRGPFGRLCCAALSGALLDSELFGDERGVFEGAPRQHEGSFEHTEGGTLFLDDVDELSLVTQAKLLRVLEDHAFERVGGKQTLQADVRVIAATTRDLEALVVAGTFREDLYYRLKVIHLALPPLRCRASDIAPLALHFLKRHAAEHAKAVESITPAALALLTEYAWPGNVRELENVVERAVVVADGPALELRDLPPEICAVSQRGGGPAIPGATLGEIERYAILKTMESAGGSTGKTAEVLGISVRKIQYKLHEYSVGSKSAAVSVPQVKAGSLGN